jgi:hypothetical protein
MTTRPFLLALLVFTLAGCAATSTTASSSPSASPRARCLVDPNETGTRPLFFLLCVESP